MADDAAYQACTAPAHAAKVVTDRLQASDEALEREMAGVRNAASARLVAQRAAWQRRLGLTATLVGLAIWRSGVLGAAVVVLAALDALLVRRRRVVGPALMPQPAADTFGDVAQELGSIMRGVAVPGRVVRHRFSAAVLPCPAWSYWLRRSR